MDLMIRFINRKGVILVDKRKIVLGAIALLVGLMLTGCAGYYSGYGYYDNPYYNDYDYGYYAYPYYQNHHEFGEHHREFGERHEWGEHHERGEHQGGSERQDGGEHHHQ